MRYDHDLQGLYVPVLVRKKEIEIFVGDFELQEARDMSDLEELLRQKIIAKLIQPGVWLIPGEVLRAFERTYKKRPSPHSRPASSHTWDI
jgi:hypothetical protein